MKPLILTLALAQGFDLTTTKIKQNQGCVEAVWPTQKVWVMGTSKALGILGVSLLSKKYPRAMKYVAIAGIGSGVGAGVWNLNQVCR